MNEWLFSAKAENSVQLTGCLLAAHQQTRRSQSNGPGYTDGDRIAGLLLIVGIIALFLYLRRRGAGTSFGTATWASRWVLQRAGMLGKKGLILGRTLKGEVIRLPSYCHVLLVGATGAGKGVSCILLQLLSYRRGSCVAFSVKNDLYTITAKFRQKFGRVYRLAPFDGGTDSLNPLDLIQLGPRLVDDARALAEALVVRTGMEHERHWDDKAVQVITAIQALVLLTFDGEERSLNSVQEIASDSELLKGTAQKLCELGGVPARLGSQLKGLFDRDGGLTKEGSGVLSTVQRHLSFLDSELVQRAVATSSFDLSELRRSKSTVYLQIGAEHLQSQAGLLRCWVSAVVKAVGRGSESEGETLTILDEASALGGLPAVEEALIRGRSAGVRLLLAYQSDSQVKAAFRDKPDLIYSNCSTQIYLGASEYETAERISKMLGDQTIVLESGGSSRSYQEGGCHGAQVSGNRNWQEHGRALMRPEECLAMSSDLLVAFVKDVPPVLARRIKWYSDPLFAARSKRVAKRLLGCVLVLLVVATLIAMLLNQSP